MNAMELQKIQERVAQQGGEHLGTLLWWSLENNHIHYSALVGLAQQHGLPEKYLPNPVKPANAFRRAWRTANRKLEKGLMLRQIAESDETIAVGLVRETADRVAVDLDYAVMGKVVFNKQHEIITVSGQGVEDIQKLYQHHLALTTQDIRFMLLQFVREAGVSLRQRGGTYFIPASWQTSLNALGRVVENAGSNMVYQLPIYDTEQVKGTLSDVARRSLDDEIRALREELEGFDEKTRQSTLERRMSRFEELRSRVKMFSGVLSFKAEDLSDKLEELHNGLRKRLGLPGDEDAKAFEEEEVPVEVETRPVELPQQSFQIDEEAGF